MVSTLSRPPQSYTTPAYVALTGIYEGGTLSFNVTLPCMLSLLQKERKVGRFYQIIMLFKPIKTFFSLKNTFRIIIFD